MFTIGHRMYFCAILDTCRCCRRRRRSGCCMQLTQSLCFQQASAVGYHIQVDLWTGILSIILGRPFGADSSVAGYFNQIRNNHPTLSSLPIRSPADVPFSSDKIPQSFCTVEPTLWRAEYMALSLARSI